MSKPNYQVIISFTSCGNTPDEAKEAITDVLEKTGLKDYYSVEEVEKE